MREREREREKGGGRMRGRGVLWKTHVDRMRGENGQFQKREGRE